MLGRRVRLLLAVLLIVVIFLTLGEQVRHATLLLILLNHFICLLGKVGACLASVIVAGSLRILFENQVQVVVDAQVVVVLRFGGGLLGVFLLLFGQFVREFDGTVLLKIVSVIHHCVVATRFFRVSATTSLLHVIIVDELGIVIYRLVTVRDLNGPNVGGLVALPRLLLLDALVFNLVYFIIVVAVFLLGGRLIIGILEVHDILVGVSVHGLGVSIVELLLVGRIVLDQRNVRHLLLRLAVGILTLVLARLVMSTLRLVLLFLIQLILLHLLIL